MWQRKLADLRQARFDMFFYGIEFALKRRKRRRKHFDK